MACLARERNFSRIFGPIGLFSFPFLITFRNPWFLFGIARQGQIGRGFHGFLLPELFPGVGFLLGFSLLHKRGWRFGSFFPQERNSRRPLWFHLFFSPLFLTKIPGFPWGYFTWGRAFWRETGYLGQKGFSSNVFNPGGKPNGEKAPVSRGLFSRGVLLGRALPEQGRGFSQEGPRHGILGPWNRDLFFQSLLGPWGLQFVCFKWGFFPPGLPLKVFPGPMGFLGGFCPFFRFCFRG